MDYLLSVQFFLVKEDLLQNSHEKKNIMTALCTRMQKNYSTYDKELEGHS